MLERVLFASSLPLPELFLEEEQGLRPGIGSGTHIAARRSTNHPSQQEWHRQAWDGEGQVASVLIIDRAIRIGMLVLVQPSRDHLREGSRRPDLVLFPCQQQN